MRIVRTRAVPDLIGGYYGSPAGWAVVGYQSFPGRCGDCPLHPPGELALPETSRRSHGSRGLHRRRRGGRRRSWRWSWPGAASTSSCWSPVPGTIRGNAESTCGATSGARIPGARRCLSWIVTPSADPLRTHLDWRRARGVGGSTLHWEGYTFRLHADDFRLRSLYGIADDWPISYPDLEPYYGRAEQALGVAGAADDPWASPRSTPFPLPAFPFSYSDGLFAPACRSLGIALHSLPQARNSVAYGGRPQCQACSTCHVCPTGAKASIDLTHIPTPRRRGTRAS